MTAPGAKNTGLAVVAPTVTPGSMVKSPATLALEVTDTKSVFAIILIGGLAPVMSEPVARAVCAIPPDKASSDAPASRLAIRLLRDFLRGSLCPLLSGSLRSFADIIFEVPLLRVAMRARPSARGHATTTRNSPTLIVISGHNLEQAQPQARRQIVGSCGRSATVLDQASRETGRPGKARAPVVARAVAGGGKGQLFSAQNRGQIAPGDPQKRAAKNGRPIRPTRPRPLPRSRGRRAAAAPGNHNGATSQPRSCRRAGAPGRHSPSSLAGPIRGTRGRRDPTAAQ